MSGPTIFYRTVGGKRIRRGEFIEKSWCGRYVKIKKVFLESWIEAKMIEINLVKNKSK